MLVDFIGEDLGERLVNPAGSPCSTAAWPGRFKSGLPDIENWPA
jgi:hypothetical protein